MVDLLLLPVLLVAVLWVRRRESVILRCGKPLNAVQLAMARAVGVAAPERVRVMAAARVAMPLPSAVRRVAERLGWLSPHIAGMTLGCGIALRADCRNALCLLAHELAHVAQYEFYSSRTGQGRYAGFLRRYLRECVWPGYPHSPLEAEARRAEAVAAHYLRSNEVM